LVGKDESVVNRISWNLHEAAILLQGLLDIRKQKIQRAEAVANISVQLRLLAEQNGYTVDEKFRNISGISLQMAHLEYALTSGKEGLRPAYKWQYDIIEIFKKKPERYKNLLKEAKEMSESLANRHSDFIAWLNKNISAEQAAVIKNAITTADILLCKSGEIRTSVLDVNDLGTIEKIINRLKTKKIIHSKKLCEQILSYVFAVKKYKGQTNAIEQKNSANCFQNHPKMPCQEDSGNKEDSFCDTAAFYSVLKKYFHNGFRLGSFIDTKKFRRYYEEANASPLTLDNDQINLIIKKCGIEHEGKIYLPDEMLSKELHSKLFNYIDHCFSDGATTVYYEAVFQHFYNNFLDCKMYDTDMLKSYIAYYAGDKYVFERSYLSKEHLGEADPTEEIRRLLKNHVYPMKITEIAHLLPNIPEGTIRGILGANLEFVRASKGVYFHADCFAVSDEELNDIANLIQDEINKNGFLSGNELYNNIKILFPYIYEKNEAFPIIGWRDALKYKLKNRFSFNGNVISSKEKPLSMSDIFSIYGKNRQKFTLSEILSFVSNVGSRVVYFDSLYKNVARVSEDEFVRKDYVIYRVSETDEVLSRYCPDDYVPISEVKNFGLFPDSTYPWNEYLLENYLAFHSKQFKLMHTGFNINCVLGAMVKQSSDIQDYDDLVIRAIAISGVPLKKTNVLSFLYEKGYIGRRSYQGIDSLLIKAREMRNRKE
jgi:hypothetical protein